MRIVFAFTLAALLSSSFVASSPAQEGTVEQLGRRLDQGLEQLTERVQRAWADVRNSLDELNVQGRVYARLRWDKAFAAAPLRVEVAENNVVTLTGQVADEDARKKAVQLAADTVGVQQVVDRLQIVPRPESGEAAAGR